ncbi:unnamed protein product [Caenorhabditis brenneri]
MNISHDKKNTLNLENPEKPEEKTDDANVKEEEEVKKIEQKETEKTKDEIETDDGSTEWTESIYSASCDSRLSFISTSSESSFKYIPIAASTPILKSDICEELITIDADAFEQMLQSLSFRLIGNMERKRIRCGYLKRHLERFIWLLKTSPSPPNAGILLVKESIISQTTTWWSKVSKCGCKIQVGDRTTQSPGIDFKQLEISYRWLKDTIVLHSEEEEEKEDSKE